MHKSHVSFDEFEQQKDVLCVIVDVSRTDADVMRLVTPLPPASTDTVETSDWRIKSTGERR